MNSYQDQNRSRSNQPDISQALENSFQRVFSSAAWLFILIIIFNVCGLIGGAASLLDRLIQGEDYVPYIGVYTASVLFILSGFGSTTMLPKRDQPMGTLLMAAITFFIITAIIGILHGRMSQ
jgi:hypothetical protein